MPATRPTSSRWTRGAVRDDDDDDESHKRRDVFCTRDRKKERQRETERNRERERQRVRKRKGRQEGREREIFRRPSPLRNFGHVYSWINGEIYARMNVISSLCTKILGRPSIKRSCTRAFNVGDGRPNDFY